MFDANFFWTYLFYGPIVDGAKLTFLLAVAAQGTGIALGLFAALGRISRSRFPIFRTITWFYLWLFRGTPLLVQIAFVYFALPQITNHQLILGEITSAYIALSLNEGAYMAEIVRAGLASVDPGQTEAAQSLGMTNWLTLRRIVIPQAVRIIIPPTGNEFISMLKNTSLAAIISTPELFFQYQQVASASFRYFEPLTIISIYYLAMTTVSTYVQGILESRFGRGFGREARQPGILNRAFSSALRRG